MAPGRLSVARWHRCVTPWRRCVTPGRQRAKSRRHEKSPVRMPPNGEKVLEILPRASGAG